MQCHMLLVTLLVVRMIRWSSSDNSRPPTRGWWLKWTVCLLNTRRDLHERVERFGAMFGNTSSLIKSVWDQKSRISESETGVESRLSVELSQLELLLIAISSPLVWPVKLRRRWAESNPWTRVASRKAYSGFLILLKHRLHSGSSYLSLGLSLLHTGLPLCNTLVSFSVTHWSPTL